MSSTESSLSIFEKAGIEIPKDLVDNKIKTVFEATGLDWLVNQREVYTNDGSNLVKLDNTVANFRAGNAQFLGIVNADKYKVVQNHEAFDFIDELPNFSFEKVGMFNGGKKVFVVGKSNEEITIDGSTDKVNFYLTFLHGHDGKSGIRFILCPVRMFCMNQLNMMLKSATFKYNIAHTGDISTKLSSIQRAISNSKMYVQGLQKEIDLMINTKTTKTIEQFTSLLIPEEDKDTDLITSRKEEARAIITDLYNNKPDIQNYKNTTFGMLSAVSDYISHAMPKRISHSTLDNAFIRNIEGNELLERSRILLAA